MKTDFTERLRNFLKEEGLEMRIMVDFDIKGNVEMVTVYKDDDEGFSIFTPWITTYGEN